MKRILSHMFSILSMVLVTIGFSSCISETHTLEDEPEEFNNTTFVLRLNTVNRYSTRADVEPQEKIKTLRIVITDETDQVEINKYFSDVSDRDFYTETENEYIIPGVTPGKKNVYIFANEESVTDISWSYTGEWGVRDLHDLLEGANNMRDDFGSHINSVTFLLNKNNISTSGLPYSASYYNLNILEGNRNEFTCYLVPVCTKFRLNFYNYRDQEITLNTVSLSSIANKTYLMAQVGNDDSYKSLPGESEKKYWIDWLHEISDLSWEYDTPVWNEWFNSQYGWITDYTIPNYSHQTLQFDGQLLRQHGTNTDPDYVITAYLNESQYPSKEQQSYQLEFSTKSLERVWVSNPWIPSLGNYEYREVERTFTPYIEGLNALFRNTYIDMDIIFSQNQDVNIEIRYTVCPWFNASPVNITFD